MTTASLPSQKIEVDAPSHVDCWLVASRELILRVAVNAEDAFDDETHDLCWKIANAIESMILDRIALEGVQHGSHDELNERIAGLVYDAIRTPIGDC